MIAVSNYLPQGLAKALSLHYQAKIWIQENNNVFDMVEDLQPTHIFLDIADITESTVKAIKEYPFIKLVIQTRGATELPSFLNKTLLVDRFFGLDIFQEREQKSYNFGSVVVCDVANISEEVKEKCLKLIAEDKLTSFGRGWPHTNHNGIAARPYIVYQNAQHVIYPYDFPTDDLIEAKFYCDNVSTDFDFPDITGQEICDKYNYVKICDGMCEFLGLPENTFTLDMESQCQSV